MATREPPGTNEKYVNRVASRRRALASVAAAGLIQRMPGLPVQYSNVTVMAKANVYFDGKVISHTVLFPDGAKKTLGVIYPGSFHFKTSAPERMEIIEGACRVTLDDDPETLEYAGSQHFDVPGNSGFTIEVHRGHCEYICSFL
jgi:uncharacterized protein YaiE (UPF0345 family)